MQAALVGSRGIAIVIWIGRGEEPTETEAERDMAISSLCEEREDGEKPPALDPRWGKRGRLPV